MRIKGGAGALQLPNLIQQLPSLTGATRSAVCRTLRSAIFKLAGLDRSTNLCSSRAPHAQSDEIGCPKNWTALSPQPSLFGLRSLSCLSGGVFRSIKLMATADVFAPNGALAR
jgi:hypothetical protein